jgi:hypothetical protein
MYTISNSSEVKQFRHEPQDVLALTLVITVATVNMKFILHEQKIRKVQN